MTKEVCNVSYDEYDNIYKFFIFVILFEKWKWSSFLNEISHKNVYQDEFKHISRFFKIKQAQKRIK